MFRRTIFLGVVAATIALVLGLSGEAYGQTSGRRSMGNLNPNPPRRSMGNFPPGQPNYYSDQGRRSSSSQRQSSGGVTVVVPNPTYPGWYYPAVPAYPAPIYTPFGRGYTYVPAPGYYAPGYYPYYYRPGYVVPRYPFAF